MKKVTFVTKPDNEAREAATPDDWVGLANKPEVNLPTKRLTVDVPVTLHQRVKSSCALQGLIMADVIRDLLEQRFPDNVAGE